MIELIVAVSFAILVSAACSLFEAVLYSVPTTYIEGMVHAGKPGGKSSRICGTMWKGL